MLLLLKRKDYMPCWTFCMVGSSSVQWNVRLEQQEFLIIINKLETNFPTEQLKDRRRFLSSTVHHPEHAVHVQVLQVPICAVAASYKHAAPLGMYSVPPSFWKLDFVMIFSSNIDAAYEENLFQHYSCINYS